VRRRGMIKRNIPVWGLFVLCFSLTGLTAQPTGSEMTPLIFSGESGQINLLSDSGPIQFACDESQVCLIDESGEFLGRLCDNGRVQFEKAKNVSIQLYDEEAHKVGFITRTGRIVINEECGKVDLIGVEECKICTFEGSSFLVHPEGEALFVER
jgi:hypothetical protein